ncbi:DUF1398 domain-containing protein [Duganella violaceipulchra]|uniref:DUF1398 domain-containing protein n=1 Tax=Duganella violaceipulchra TaxID=2849652 RepID=A0AA41L384_9BURK|nr:DUF1398 domain-containing protein [Duganella violaceicalia]MBV6321414.1 DUF1398 domain-containing protein [Duganella violaceicalia]MCP2009337.1 uncharacterized protein YbcV (DUF1398 family) [Duganella violaceicalia]
MEASTRDTIEQCARESHAGLTSFGALVGRLMQAGIESYHADYRRCDTTYYLPDGATHAVALPAPDAIIPQQFDAAALVQAIRSAQHGAVHYPEFMALSMAAGCVGYMVWIAGRHVSYFGHRGEVHIEHFPPA